MTSGVRAPSDSIAAGPVSRAKEHGDNPDADNNRKRRAPAGYDENRHQGSDHCIGRKIGPGCFATAGRESQPEGAHQQTDPHEGSAPEIIPAIDETDSDRRQQAAQRDEPDEQAIHWNFGRRHGKQKNQVIHV